MKIFHVLLLKGHGATRFLEFWYNFKFYTLVYYTYELGNVHLSRLLTIFWDFLYRKKVRRLFIAISLYNILLLVLCFTFQIPNFTFCLHFKGYRKIKIPFPYLTYLVTQHIYLQTFEISRGKLRRE